MPTLSSQVVIARPCCVAAGAWWKVAVPLLALLAAFAAPCRADGLYATDGLDVEQRILAALPAPISEGLEIDAWAWFSYLHNSAPHHDITDTELSLDITKSFAQRVAITFEGNLINADGAWRGEVEQLYVSLRPSDQYAGILTLGKFNAGFGSEERDFWNRTHGTTSLLFGAQPQDLVGAIATLPVEQLNLTLRPFVGLDFQGQPEYNQPPLAGLQVLCKPTPELRFSLTNFTGPGLIVFGGAPLRHPFPQDQYASGEYGGYEPSKGGGDIGAIENWQGPNLYAERRGTLFFSDAHVRWQPRNDLTLSAEGLFATTGTARGHVGWWGVMVSGEFNITDRLWIFARYSYLDDSDWLVTGSFQKVWECSGGVGYKLLDKVEIRAECRHDRGSQTGNSDTFSVDVTAGF